MGIISSNNNNSSGSCQTPAMTKALFETKFNSNTESSLDEENSRIPITMQFRADEGDLTTFGAIAVKNGYTVPTSTGTVTATGSLAQIKRPNCECTTMHKFNMDHATCTSCMVSVTFEDGYTVQLGRKIQMLKVTNTGLANFSLEDLYVGDMVVKCGSNGNVNTTSTECVKITSITKGISIAVATSFAYQPESLFPKNQFSGSHCVFSLMIENGVYIFMTPAGGSY
jgi:hypothetical protein